ncbi:hypothetical protein LguiA_013186 [Lonicera macranthoides]
MFHGLYDPTYTAKIMTGLPLPDMLNRFHSLLGDVFESITNMKFIARFCVGLNSRELGLERLARIIKVTRIGGAHQQYLNKFKIGEGEYYKNEEDNNIHDDVGRGRESYEKPWMGAMKSLGRDEEEDLQDTKEDDGDNGGDDFGYNDDDQVDNEVQSEEPWVEDMQDIEREENEEVTTFDTSNSGSDDDGDLFR